MLLCPRLSRNQSANRPMGITPAVVGAEVEVGRRDTETALSQLILRSGGGRNRPFFPAVAPQICLVLLAIQALPVLSGHILFNPFGVRFGVRLRTPSQTEMSV